MADINKELTQIKTAIYGKDVRGSIHDGIDKINKESEGSRAIANDNKNRQDSLEQQFDDLQQNYSEGTPSTAEVVAARTNTDTSENYSTIGRRMDDEYKKVTSQLNDSAKGLYYNTKKGVVKNKLTKGYAVIIDDDGRRQLYDLFYPYVKQKGIKINAAIVSDRITNPSNDMYNNTISLDEFKEMKDDPLIQFCNHTNTHVHLAELTDDEIRDEIGKCEDFLMSHGIFSKHLVYPFGSVNEKVKTIASNYVNSATKANGLIVDPSSEVIDTYQMNRVVFEESTSTIKNRIDQVKNRNGCLIINTHSQYETFDLEKLDEIVDYANQQGIEFIHVDEMYELFGNILEFREGDELKGGVSANGFTDGFLKAVDAVVYVDAEGLKANDSPDKYPNRKISTTNIRTQIANEGGWDLGAGVLFTDRRGPDDYTYQIYHPINKISTEVYKRKWLVAEGYWEHFRIIGDINRASKVYTPSTTTVSAKGYRGYTVNDAQFRLGDSLIINPNKTISRDIFYRAMIVANGVAEISLFNNSENEIDLAGVDWILKPIRN